MLIYAGVRKTTKNASRRVSIARHTPIPSHRLFLYRYMPYKDKTKQKDEKQLSNNENSKVRNLILLFVLFCCDDQALSICQNCGMSKCIGRKTFGLKKKKLNNY